MRRYLSKWGLLCLYQPRWHVRCKHQTPLYTSPGFLVDWLINSFLPYQLVFLITGGQPARTNTFGEALFPIYISFTDFLLSQPYLNLCSIQEVIKLEAKANVRVIMRQIRLKILSFFFFFKDLTHTWSARWPAASGKFPFSPGCSQSGGHVKNGTTSRQVWAAENSTYLAKHSSV